MVVGWIVFLGGILTMTGVIRGWLPANAWTLNALQGASIIEAAVWMAVLGVRMQELRAAAQRVQTEREALLRMAHTDALTGLPNRRALAAALQDALRAAVPGRAVGVYLLDLDGFKPINDRFGHETGDALLIAVARRLREQVRSSDLVARLGGDEFVVMAGGLGDDADAQRLGSKLLETFAAPFVIDGRPHRVGVTVGYALAPADGRDLAGLLRRADAAMYEGKQAGGNRLRRGGAVTAAAASA